MTNSHIKPKQKLPDTKNISKSGHRMKPETKNKIIDILINPEHDGLSKIEIAKIIKISTKTLRCYLTAEMWAEIRKLRLDVMHKSLARVDRAIFAKASNGDVAAAKLIYSRWDELNSLAQQEGINFETLEEIDAEIKKLREEIQKIEEQGGSSPTEKTSDIKK